MKNTQTLYHTIKNILIQLFFNQKKFINQFSFSAEDGSQIKKICRKKYSYHEIVIIAIDFNRLDMIQALEKKGFSLHYHYGKWLKECVLYERNDIAQYLISKNNFALKPNEIHQCLMRSMDNIILFSSILQYSKQHHGEMSYDEEINEANYNYNYNNSISYSEIIKELIYAQPVLSQIEVFYPIINMMDITLLKTALMKCNKLKELEIDGLMLQTVDLLTKASPNISPQEKEQQINKLTQIYHILLSCYKDDQTKLESLEKIYQNERITRCIVTLAINNYRDLFWKTLEVADEEDKGWLLKHAFNYTCSQKSLEMMVDILSQRSLSIDDKIYGFEIALRDVDSESFKLKIDSEIIVCETLLNEIVKDGEAVKLEEKIKEAINNCSNNLLKKHMGDYYEKILFHYHLNKGIAINDNIKMSHSKL